MKAYLALPQGTRTITFTLHGTRQTGSDNDSYFDDLDLRLAVQEVVEPGDDDDEPGDDDDTASADDDDGPGLGGEGDDCACMSATGPASTRLSGLFVLALLLRRREAATRS